MKILDISGWYCCPTCKKTMYKQSPSVAYSAMDLILEPALGKEGNPIYDVDKIKSTPVTPHDTECYWCGRKLKSINDFIEIDKDPIDLKKPEEEIKREKEERLIALIKLSAYIAQCDGEKANDNLLHKLLIETCVEPWNRRYLNDGLSLYNKSMSFDNLKKEILPIHCTNRVLCLAWHLISSDGVFTPNEYAIFDKLVSIFKLSKEDRMFIETTAEFLMQDSDKAMHVYLDSLYDTKVSREAIKSAFKDIHPEKTQEEQNLCEKEFNQAAKDYDNKNYDNAYSSFSKAIDFEIDSAWYYLGNCLYYGNGIEKDETKGNKYLIKAAEKANGSFCNEIGYNYDNGNGIERDYTKAVFWFSKGAEKGDCIAIENLGLMYKCGRGVSKDFKKANELFLQAAELGRVKAMVKLAEHYEDGLGFNVDYDKAIEWYKKAKLKNVNEFKQDDLERWLNGTIKKKEEEKKEEKARIKRVNRAFKKLSNKDVDRKYRFEDHYGTSHWLILKNGRDYGFDGRIYIFWDDAWDFYEDYARMGFWAYNEDATIFATGDCIKNLNTKRYEYLKIDLATDELWFAPEKDSSTAESIKLNSELLYKSPTVKVADSILLIKRELQTIVKNKLGFLGKFIK